MKKKDEITITGLSIEGIIAALKVAVEVAGSKTEAAAKLGVSAVYLGDVINGNRTPGKKILDAMNLEPVTVYRRK